jgi:hypothetical protein
MSRDLAQRPLRAADFLQQPHQARAKITGGPPLLESGLRCVGARVTFLEGESRDGVTVRPQSAELAGVQDARSPLE